MTTVEPIVHNQYPVEGEKVLEMMERKDFSILEKLGGVDGLCSALEVDKERGITSSTVDARRAQFGRNELAKKDPVRYIDYLIEAFGDRIVQILCVAAVISIIFGLTLPNPHSGHVELEKGWIEGFAIILSVSAVTLTGSIQNYQKALKFEQMENEQSIKFVACFRDGEEHSLDTRELCVGDLVVVEGGVLLTCDGVYISGTDLKCNEAAMTGESDILKKNADRDCFFLSGTLVEEGEGLMMVVAVGMGSFQGKLKETTDEESGETPLQEHLTDLADKIGIFGFVGALVLVVALCIKEGILIAKDEKDAHVASFLNFVIIAITLVVVAIPEGLPLAVTISLAFSMQAMARDNCLVRVLASCETMGAATAICSDKTGTLTTNIMAVVQGLVAEEEFVIQGYGLVERNMDVHKIDRNAPTFSTSKDSLDQFCFGLSVNSTAREHIIDGVKQWVGNKTEHGLLGYVAVCGHDYKEMRDRVASSDKRQFPFNSKKKRMTTLVRDSDGLLTAHCKGASEVILDDCDRYMDSNGAIVDLNPVKRQQFLDVITDMANQGNRTIGIALSSCPFTEFPEDEPSLSMVFLGVMGIQDPIRSEVPVAVTKCHSAGLIIRMVTGDNINTAMAIGKKCNIYAENGWDLAMTGKELREQYDEGQSNPEAKSKLLDMLPRLRILARSSPSDKHILVGLLQEIGEVVGVTGDGTNDAPALKLADVGFAMNSGTDIAKGAADMVLVDDNFASVVNAIRWGRAVNDNIRKFLQFQLSINVAGVLLTVVGSLASETSKEPFNAVQLLWLNLIMDTMAALALATERPEEASLTRPPVYKQAPLISNKMRLFIGIHATFQTALMLVIIFTGHTWLNTIDNPDRCTRDWPAFRTNTTYIKNDSTTEWQNVTAWKWVPSFNENYCRDLCVHEGGVFHVSSGICQQGRVHSTIIFNTFIFMQIFNIFNARKIYDEVNCFEGIHPRSHTLLKVFGVILVFQVVCVQTFDDFMGTTLLQPNEFFICVGFGAIELLLGFIPRMIPIKDYVPDVVIHKKKKEEELRHEVHKHHKHGLFVRRDSSLRRTNSMQFSKHD